MKMSKSLTVRFFMFVPFLMGFISCSFFKNPITPVESAYIDHDLAGVWKGSGYDDQIVYWNIFLNQENNNEYVLNSFTVDKNKTITEENSFIFHVSKVGDEKYANVYITDEEDTDEEDTDEEDTDKIYFILCYKIENETMTLVEVDDKNPAFKRKKLTDDSSASLITNTSSELYKFFLTYNPWNKQYTGSVLRKID